MYTKSLTFFHITISRLRLFVDFILTMSQFSSTHHKEVVSMSWVDWCGKMLKDRSIFLLMLGLNS